MPSAVVRFLPLLLVMGLGAPISSAAGGHAQPAALAPNDALILLQSGNQRFVADEAVHFQQDARRRADTARNGQKPFAVILTCSDSRVPPELVFDQGIGSLFVIRVAGNVARTDEIASIEYAVGHLGTRLIVVMGHTACGAVTAVVEELEVGPNLEQLVAPILPACERARTQNPGLRGSRLVEAAIRANVDQAISDLLRFSPEIELQIEHGRVRIVGAVYDLETGHVNLLDPANESLARPAAGHPQAPRPVATPAAQAQRSPAGPTHPAPAPGHH